MAAVTRAYLDHAATTPMVPAAAAAVTETMQLAGNPSSLHTSGRKVRRVLEESREQIAALLGAKPAEVIFTSGGTEANNLALKGVLGAASEPRSDIGESRRELVVSAVEHQAVMDPAHWLVTQAGVSLREVGVDDAGRVDLGQLAAAVNSQTALVSVMWANNEIGTLQPVTAVAELAHAAGAWAHSDAVQAAGHVRVDFAASGLDLMTVCAHKLGGPVGVGALVAKRELSLMPVLHGGGQERDVRSGTLDAAGAAGFAAALEVAVSVQATESARLEGLRQELIAGVLAAAPDAVVHGPAGAADRVAGIVNVELAGCSQDALLLLFDAAGIDCSTGSACSAGVAQPSPVLLAMGRTPAQARSALRFSLGHTSTAADIERLTNALPEVLRRARAAGSLR